MAGRGQLFSFEKFNAGATAPRLFDRGESHFMGCSRCHYAGEAGADAFHAAAEGCSDLPLALFGEVEEDCGYYCTSLVFML